MKKLITLTGIIILVASGSIFAQKPELDYNLFGIDPNINLNPYEYLYTELLIQNEPNNIQFLSSNKQSLDSIVEYHFNEDSGKWYNMQKYSYTYDDNGNITKSETYTQQLNELNWIIRLKEECVYGYDGLLAENIKYRESSTKGNLYIEYKLNYIYNADGKVIDYIFSDYDTTSKVWTDLYKREYTYDTNGFLHETVGSRFNIDLNQWYITTNTVDSFDSSNNPLESITYIFDTTTSQWSNSYKKVHIYDENGNKTQYSEYEWNEDSLRWDGGEYQLSFSYDAYNNMTQMIHHSWNMTFWLPIRKYIFIPDESGVLLADTLSSNSYIDTSWVYDASHEYTYDDHGNCIVQNTYGWNLSTNTWNGPSQDYAEFDTTCLLSDIYAPDISYYQNMDFKNKILTLYNGTSSKKVYYYSEQNPTSLPNTKYILDVSLYPNPASEYIMIELTQPLNPAKFELYDVQGRKVFSQKLENSNVSISHLDGGLYLYRITNGNQIKTGKLMIAR